MSKETNTQTTASFIRIWYKNPDRLEPELRSVHNETNRIPDPSIFIITNKGLIDPKTNKPVREFIRNDTSFYKREFKVFETLESWAKDAEDDIAVWISPPYPEKYPCAKATFSRVSYDWQGTKYLQNTSILFGDEKTTRLDIFPNPKINNLEKLREVIFVIDEKTALKAIKKIQTLGAHFEENEESLNKEIIEYIKDIKAGTPPSLIIAGMQTTGFLGNHPISCSPAMGFSDYLSTQVTKIDTKFVRNCGNCGAIINSFISAGYICPKCGGVYKGC